MTKGPAINHSMGALEWGMVILLALVWGGSFFFNEVAVRELPTLTVVVGRVVLAAVILHILLRSFGQRMPTSFAIWRAFFCMGLINNVIPFTLIVWGQIHIASGVASILNATTPLFTVLVAHWMTADEKITGGRVVGVLVGLVGVVIMIGGDVLSGLGTNVFAQIAVLAAALSYAFAGVYGRRFRALEVSPMATATGQVTASSVLMVPAMLIIDQPWLLPLPSAAAIWSLIGVAALSTAFAYILYFRILATAGATNLLLVTFLVPVSAILLGVLILGEVLLPKHLMGMALIGLGLAAIDGRPWRSFRGLFGVKA